MTPDTIAQALRNVYDPELGVDIVALGLVYGIDVEDQHVDVTMTMTSPDCPMGSAILDAVRQTLEWHFPEAEIDVRLASSPPWHIAMVDESTRRAFGRA